MASEESADGTNLSYPVDQPSTDSEPLSPHDSSSDTTGTGSGNRQPNDISTDTTGTGSAYQPIESSSGADSWNRRPGNTASKPRLVYHFSADIERPSFHNNKSLDNASPDLKAETEQPFVCQPKKKLLSSRHKRKGQTPEGYEASASNDDVEAPENLPSKDKDTWSKLVFDKFQNMLRPKQTKLSAAVKKPQINRSYASGRPKPSKNKHARSISCEYSVTPSDIKTGSKSSSVTTKRSTDVSGNGSMLVTEVDVSESPDQTRTLHGNAPQNVVTLEPLALLDDMLSISLPEDFKFRNITSKQGSREMKEREINNGNSLPADEMEQSHGEKDRDNASVFQLDRNSEQPQLEITGSETRHTTGSEILTRPMTGSDISSDVQTVEGKTKLTNGNGISSEGEITAGGSGTTPDNDNSSDVQPTNGDTTATTCNDASSDAQLHIYANVDQGRNTSNNSRPNTLDVTQTLRALDILLEKEASKLADPEEIELEGMNRMVTVGEQVFEESSNSKPPTSTDSEHSKKGYTVSRKRNALAMMVATLAVCLITTGIAVVWVYYLLKSGIFV